MGCMWRVVNSGRAFSSFLVESVIPKFDDVQQKVCFCVLRVWMRVGIGVDWCWLDERVGGWIGRKSQGSKLRRGALEESARYLRELTICNRWFLCLGSGGLRQLGCKIDWVWGAKRGRLTVVGLFCWRVLRKIWCQGISEIWTSGENHPSPKILGDGVVCVWYADLIGCEVRRKVNSVDAHVLDWTLTWKVWCWVYLRELTICNKKILLLAFESWLIEFQDWLDMIYDVG